MENEQHSENLDEKVTVDEKTQPDKKKKFRVFPSYKSLYAQRKADIDQRRKTVIFGVLAIVYSFACLALCYPCVWVGIKGTIFAFTHYFGPLTWFLGVGNLVIFALSIGAALVPFWFWFQGIRLVIMQFWMNFRFISWLALLIWLACFAGVFLLSLESFLVLTGAGHVFE